MTTGTSPCLASRTDCCIAASRLRRCTRLHSMCRPCNDGATTSFPSKPLYCTPLRAGNPNEVSTLASSRSPRAPFCLLFIRRTSMWLRFILRTVVGVILRDVTRPVMQHAINRTMKANHKRREIRRKRELAELRQLEELLGPPRTKTTVLSVLQPLASGVPSKRRGSTSRTQQVAPRSRLTKADTVTHSNAPL